MCSQGYCNCNVCIELTLFQMISLLQGVILFCVPFNFTRGKKKALWENGNYEKSPNLVL